jgi:alpha-galactosidase
MSVLPEQSASWAYPQPEMSAEEIAFCMVTGMMGRLYLSGYLDRMSPAQVRLVADGIATHKLIRAEIARAVPVWPLGLPGWTDSWIALGLHPQEDTNGATYLAVWRRPGAATDVSCRLPHLAGRPVEPELVYPTALESWAFSWDRPSSTLAITASGSDPAARLIRLGPPR